MNRPVYRVFSIEELTLVEGKKSIFVLVLVHLDSSPREQTNNPELVSACSIWFRSRIVKGNDSVMGEYYLMVQNI